MHVVNLLGQTSENQLRELYRFAVDTVCKDINKRIPYTEFDFNAIIKRDNYERLDDFVQMVKPALESYSYYVQDITTNETCSKQRGVFRSNCLDCLDRTNVIQTYDLNF